MKKQILGLAILLTAGLGYNTASAQSADSRTITVNVELKDVFGAGGGGEGGSGATGADQLSFVYDNAGKYNNEQTQTITNQINAVATGAYKITVKANEANFTSANSTLPLDILRISASKTGEGAFGTAITPTTTAQDIFTGGTATAFGQGYDVKYDIPVNNTLATGVKEPYKATFVFTVTAP